MAQNKITDNIAIETAHARNLVEHLKEYDDSDLNADMIEGETAFFEAVQTGLEKMIEFEAMETGIKEMKRRLDMRGDRAKAGQEKIRGLIEQAFAMAGIDGRVFDCATISIKNLPPKLIVTDEAEIPSKYWEPQPPKLDRKGLTADAKTGKVEGAEMSNGGKTIQIRWA